MRVGGQRHAPVALTPRKTRHPLYRSLGGPQGRSGRVRIRSPDRPASSESLYRLSYSGRRGCVCRHKKLAMWHNTTYTVILALYVYVSLAREWLNIAETCGWLRLVINILFINVPPCLKFKNSLCWLRCIYVFCTDLRTNSKFCLIQH